MNFELYLSDFVTLALAHFMALLSPGVDFFIILSNSAKHGKVVGVVISFGIALANLLYILMALYGINLIKEHLTLFTVIKLLGALYLLYIGYSLLKSKKRSLFSKEYSHKKHHKAYIKYFFMGFLSALLNPKNSIFYFTIFSLSIQNDTPMMVQGLFALWLFLAVLFWDIFIVSLVTNQNTKNFLEKYTYHIEIISGIVLVIIALFIFKFTLF